MTALSPAEIVKEILRASPAVLRCSLRRGQVIVLTTTAGCTLRSLVSEVEE